jgi:DNA-directed RNA polymerase specialized sigma24 family protein
LHCGAALAFKGVSFAPMLSTLRVREPPDERLRQAQREAVARVNWKDLLPRLEAFAIKRGASSSEAMDAVQSAIAGLLDGRTTWNPVEGPDISDYMMATVRRILGHEHKSARHRYEAPSDTVEDAPDPHGDPSSTQEATAAREADRLEQVRLALEGDTLALQVLDLLTSGVTRAVDQAAHLGVPVGTVYDARDRLSRCARRIAKGAAEGQKEGRTA